MKTTFLYLVRHGAIIEVNGKRYIGQTEAPLSEAGVEQAWALRDWLHETPFQRVLCSDLTRSVRTTQIILGARGIPYEPHRQLREIHLGSWEGYAFREVKEKFPEEFAARGSDLENWRPPGGESFADCRERVWSFLRPVLEESEGNLLLAGHAGVNRVILCEALGLPTAQLMHIGQTYGCLNIIEFGPRRARVHLLNFIPGGPSSAVLQEGTGIPGTPPETTVRRHDLPRQ